MAKMNVASSHQPVFTHEGAKAQHLNPELQLRRSVMSCLLWEKEFYEDGQTITQRIAEVIPHVKPEKVAAIAIEAREQMKLRHIPLFICSVMAGLPEHKGLVSSTLSRIIQRVDELTEFLAIYWKDGKHPLSAQIKKGLASAFTKFDEYGLAKYNRDNAIKLRDVLFLCHAKPQNDEQAALWKRLIAGELVVPDTWEVALSTGKDKKETWERLLRENKLGALALLRNLRNMAEAKVTESLVFDALGKLNVARVLPFRFITAAKHAPQWEAQIEPNLLKCLGEKPKLQGKTFILVDVSGSMESPLSAKSELSRMDVAASVAMLAREITDCRIFTFSNTLVEVPARHGFALRDVITNSQAHSGTHLGAAVTHLTGYDRLIVVTDEQTADQVPAPSGKGYIINVASDKNGVGYGKWLHIDGWSEAVLDYISTWEQNNASPINIEGS